LPYIRAEGQAGRLGTQLLATVVDDGRQRAYVAPDDEQERAARAIPQPDEVPETELSTHPQYMGAPRYGLAHHADLFMPRQLLALTTFSDLVREAKDTVARDAAQVLEDASQAEAYVVAVCTYLACAVSRAADYWSTGAVWATTGEFVAHTFSRQAIPLVWNFAEAAPLQDSSGNWAGGVEWIARVLERFPARGRAVVTQVDATTLVVRDVVCSTDPPYYDNIPYSDLADYFYVWLRRSLADSYPDLLGTVLTPKTEELVADQYRLGSRAKAQEFFKAGFLKTFRVLREGHRTDVPMTVYYAFKQTESAGEDGGVVSTGWEKLLEALIEAGWVITATWPMRTERSGRPREIGSNALASSIVLACRVRESTASAVSRREFIRALHAELPAALRDVQTGSIAPVDLAQTAIGPGMAVFSRYSTVIEADGSAMTVRTALALINQALDEVLVEQEGDFDSDRRFCVKWFTQFGWDDAEFGQADQLSRSTNTAVDGLVRSGIFWARAGRARLLAPDDLSSDWDPATDDRISVWDVVLRVAKALNEQGGDESARLMAGAGQRVDLDTAKELAYLLYRTCEQRRWTDSALLFNGLGTSWTDLASAARSATARAPSAQGALDFEDEDDG